MTTYPQSHCSNRNPKINPMKLEAGKRYIAKSIVPGKGLFAKDTIYRNYGTLYYGYKKGDANPPTHISIDPWVQWIPIKDFKLNTWARDNRGDKYRVSEA